MAQHARIRCPFDAMTRLRALSTSLPLLAVHSRLIPTVACFVFGGGAQYPSGFGSDTPAILLLERCVWPLWHDGFIIIINQLEFDFLIFDEAWA